MDKDTYKTVVVFRVWRSGTGKGDVIALFPGVRCDDRGYRLCSSYEHVGQHGGADYCSVLDRTRRSALAEYADLKRELEAIGYNLDVRQRRQRRQR